jgi:NAD(P)-dependent dehydrogenase (short-subunit alcohol dehydrogenase family)
MPQNTVLITGCSSGIGLALAMEFKRRGWLVIATARRPEPLQNLIRQGLIAEKLDVTSEDDIRRVARTIFETHGALDMLINNAGYGVIAPIVEVESDTLVKQFHTNVFAPLELVRQFVPPMIKKGKGTVVNIGSVSGVLTTPFSGAYCASKAALHALSDALRLELAPFGINVITVQPGGVRSQFGQKAGQLVKRVLKEDSWYQPIRSFIEQRAAASQENAMPAEEFARKLLDKILTDNPPPVVRLGSKSKLMPFLKWSLPVAGTDAILTKKFGLNKLKAKINPDSK